MTIDILTLFPKIFDNVLNESMIKRARERGRVRISVHNLRNWTHDRHRTADDKPYGGGAGMVLKPEPVFEAVDELIKGSRALRAGGETKKAFITAKGRKRLLANEARIVLLTPQGKRLDQRRAKRLSKYKHLILICGHYEGVDERIRRYLATDEISIGDYILTCGELPAMVLIDSLIRFIPGVLGHKDAARFESFEKWLLEYPQYTRPAEYRKMAVPKILLSGNHKKIAKWRRGQALKRTKRRRPDLYIRHYKESCPIFTAGEGKQAKFCEARELKHLG